MGQSKCTMLVNSCDAYSDVWFAFFKILKHQWENLDMPIVLNTEKKTFSMEDLEIKTLNILEGKSEDIPWGERLIDALKRISTPYVLFMLDDYLLEEPVDSKVVEDCIKWMDADKDIVSFTLVPSGFFYEKDYKSKLECPYPGFGLREKKDAKLVAGPGIWRREKLISVIRPFEDPWVWELYGSMRERRNKGKFYGRKADASPVFVYDHLRGGAIHRGLWVGCTVRPLLEKFDIQIDLNKRGVDEDWLKHPPQYKRFDIVRIVRNRVKMIRSLFF